ncbi:hypothetical protein [Mycobacterium uberis]|nr:hypothetical protein [Mycobacterium uberis]
MTQKYPLVLFTTSTRDDRVHPGHVRAMTAAFKPPVTGIWYYENYRGRAY